MLRVTRIPSCLLLVVLMLYTDVYMYVRMYSAEATSCRGISTVSDMFPVILNSDQSIQWCDNNPLIIVYFCQMKPLILLVVRIFADRHSNMI